MTFTGRGVEGRSIFWEGDTVQSVTPGMAGVPSKNNYIPKQGSANGQESFIGLMLPCLDLAFSWAPRDLLWGSRQRTWEGSALFSPKTLTLDPVGEVLRPWMLSCSVRAQAPG